MISMKYSNYLFVLLALLWSNNLFAYDIAVDNGNGVTIYYNYINDGKELEVTYQAIIHTKLDNGMYREEYRSYQNIEEIVIPEEVTYMDRTRKVTSIGDHAFHDSKDLISITIPPCVVRIGNVVFQNCNKLNSIQISDLEAWCNISFGTNFHVPHLFLNGEEVKELTIPQGVTSFSRAFSCCQSLTSVTIPNGVTKIDDYAFLNCINLTMVSIPKSVTAIGTKAFASCFNLSTITIPNSVTSIGDEAFINIDFSTVLSFIQNPFTFNPKSSIFTKNTLYNATLYVPKGTINMYKATEGWNSFVFIEELDSDTGIEIITSENDIKDIYSLGGTKLQLKSKGVNIIKLKDGNTKKIYVK